ncbi:MAG: hypothetical protein CMH54_09745 [Myxococcales bacterium]|nr:hypothetical protein [Myxococcales bacterium]
MRKFLFALFVLLFWGCSTLNGARPLGPQQHEAGLVLGGPLLKLGGSPIPTPNAILSFRSGLKPIFKRALEIDYGLNLTAAAFGIGQTHIGVSWQLAKQRGWRPAVSATRRLYLATDAKTFWSAKQDEVLASWLFGQQLLYVGLANYAEIVPWEYCRLRLTPVVGLSLDPFAKDGFRFQLEWRWFNVNEEPETEAIEWVPASRGAYGLSFGFSYLF